MITMSRRVPLHFLVVALIVMAAPVYDASLVANATLRPADISARITTQTGLQPSEIDSMFAAEQAADLVLIPYEIVIPVVLEPKSGYLLVRIAATGQWIRVPIDQTEWENDFKPYFEQYGITVHKRPRGTINALTAAQDAAEIAAGASVPGSTTANLILYGNSSGPLPPNPTATVGRTTGQSAVSVVGEGQYSIPIFTPPGINGLSPDIALAYGHRQPEGLAGIGWTVAGLSAITRCGKSLAQDGQSKAIELTLVDRFCLDGNQLRLVSGSYGTAGSEYRTEVDLVAKIVATGTAGNGPASFTVWQKSGLIYEYGTSNDSRIESLASGFTTTAHTWALRKIRDRQGNEIVFNYEEDGAPHGDFRVSSIDYGGNPGAAVAARYTISFHYELQPVANIDTQYVAGGKVVDTKRIDRIDVSFVEPAPDELVRRYDLTYELSLSNANRSRLQSVKECAGSPLKCLSPLTFTYQNGTLGLGSETLSGSTIPSGTTPISLDLNGDGFTDLVYPSSSGSGSWMYRLADGSGGYGAAVNSGIANTNHAMAVPFDYNNDGFDDILVQYSGTTWWAILGSASGLQSPIDTGTPAAGAPGDVMALDIDADGREDLVWGVNLGTYNSAVYVRYQLASGGFSSSPTTLASTVGSGRIGSLKNYFRQSRANHLDVKGDGQKDLALARA